MSKNLAAYLPICFSTSRVKYYSLILDSVANVAVKGHATSYWVKQAIFLGIVLCVIVALIAVAIVVFF